MPPLTKKDVAVPLQPMPPLTKRCCRPHLQRKQKTMLSSLQPMPRLTKRCCRPLQLKAEAATSSLQAREDDAVLATALRQLQGSRRQS
jgi:hypothetical protein